MIQQLVPIALGFILTTVVGGLLGFLFQRRSWTHQHDVQFAEQERERAVKVFEEVSRLLDKRLYRMRLLYWILSDKSANEPDDSTIANQRMDGYRDVLLEWNDGINRNLALTQQYFGENMRDRLDYAIGASYVAVGRDLQAMWKSRNAPPGKSQTITDIGRRLDELGGLVYGFNLAMIRAIQAGEVGWLVAGHRVAPKSHPPLQALARPKS